MTEDPVISNEAMAVYYKQEKIATNLLKKGCSPEFVACNTELPLSFVNEIKKALDQGMIE